jgi:uncharacterized DUF497 family protein
VQFEWDPSKADLNEAKHSVSFMLASSVFYDPLAWTFDDPRHSHGEVRYLTIGVGADGRTLVVSHIEPDDDIIRIISARVATSRERVAYEES